MSAFIVSDDVMHRCVSAIVRRANDRTLGSLGHFAPTMARLLESPQTLGDALSALNERAVRARYPGEDFAGPRYMARLVDCSEIVGFKALECLRYQCSENGAMDDPLYAELSELIDSLARDMVRRMPGYEQAPWG